MAEAVDIVVVGAGVVGLAVARCLAQAGHETLVLEKNRRIGEETSARNSGVIHSGIYYPAGSLKARLCVAGRDQLYEYCEQRGIAHRRAGKIIVAQQSQVAALQTLRAKGVANGVTDLQWLSGDEVAQLEPRVRCAAGLLSPSTGIIDVHDYMTALAGDFEAAGGSIVVNCELLQARVDGDGLEIEARSGDEVTALRCRWLINSGGLHALGLLRRIAGYPSERMRAPLFAKGNYYSCRGERPFRHLIYPMPNEAGLGVHATLDLDGTTRFGPDVEWIENIDYDVDPARSLSFYDAIREYWPGLPDEALQPAYAGIRPKLTGPGTPAADFEIEDHRQHGVRGLVNLLGIESPGLTSSLAIAAEVASRL